MNLIYTTAFGEPYYSELADELVKSLIRAGYHGDIIVLTDKEREFPGHAVAKAVKVVNGLWKCALLQTDIDIKKYEKILFLDSDISVIRNPALLFALEGIHIAMEDFPLHENAMNSQFLTPEEKLRAKEKDLISVNAGTFIVPGALAEKFFIMWETAWRNSDKDSAPDLWLGAHKDGEGKVIKEWWDQGVLQALCMRDLPWKPIPREFVNMPCLEWNDRKVTEETVLIHFNGLLQNKENKEAILGWIRDMENPQAIEVTCAKAYAACHLHKKPDVMEQRLKSIEARLTALETR